jgi:hypothetical protein
MIGFAQRGIMTSLDLLSRLALCFAVVGCVGGEDPATSVAVGAGSSGDYVGHQGRLLLGFKPPDVRRFSLPTTVTSPQVDPRGQLIATGLSGRDFIGMPMTATAPGATISMRVADVFPPASPDFEWQYLLEQQDPVLGVWSPACAEPLPLFPPTTPVVSPPRAIAMQGWWTSDGLYTLNSNVITFACKTGVVGKCDGWGYRATSDPPDVTENGMVTTVTGPDMLQACTRMAHADYCALGDANTLDGTPIMLDDIFITPIPTPGFAFEAAWPGVASTGRAAARPPAICLSKLRWSTLPLGGCPLLPDPRTDVKGVFCDDIPQSTLEKKGALTYSSSLYIDAGLYTYTDTTGLRLTTSQLVPGAVTQLPTWLIPPPAGVTFPVTGETQRYEATIFALELPSDNTAGDLVKLTTYQCADDLVTAQADAEPKCLAIASNGYVYPPNTPGRAPLRRWLDAGGKRAWTTTMSPSQMFAAGYTLTHVVGSVIRGALDLNIRWSALAGATYSLDIETRGGVWIAPCVDSTLQGSSTSFVYRGLCNSAPGRGVDHADIAAFRINYTIAGVTRSVVQTYNGADSDAYIALPGGRTTALAIHWNDIGEDARYVVTLRPGSGGFTKCVDDALLANDTTYVHTDQCPSTGNFLKIPTLTGVRVCAVWPFQERKAVCADAAYDGVQPSVTLALPGAM